MTLLQNTPEAFRQQLRDGHYNELRVALHLMLRGWFVRVGFRDGRYDIETHNEAGSAHRIEVKWDKRAAETGNLYFEVENTRQRRPSGVMSTTASLWVHVPGQGAEAFMVPVPALRTFLHQGRFRSVCTGGADSNSRGLLVPRSRLEEIPAGGWVRLPTVEEFFGELFREAAPPAGGGS